MLMKGTYVLLARLDKDREIGIGSLGSIKFRKGFYAYVGSGQGSLEKRVGRHFSAEKKRHWHIDYFLEKAGIEKAIFWESGREECELAERMAERFGSVRKFGCSDCGCGSHLFYSGRRMEKGVKEAVRSLPGPRSPFRTARSRAS